MNTNHSPLPWKNDLAIVRPVNLREFDVALCGKITDAAYIVQSCNAYPALVEALDAIAAMRPPLMTKEQEKAFEYHPSTCDAYRVDMAKVLLNAIMEARAALALARGEKGESK